MINKINKINKVNKSVVLASILICLNTVNSAETNTPGYSSHERPELSQDQLQRAEEKENRVLAHSFRVLHDFYNLQSQISLCGRLFAILNLSVATTLGQAIDYLLGTFINRRLFSFDIPLYDQFKNFITGIIINKNTQDTELIQYIRERNGHCGALRHDERIHILLSLTTDYRSNLSPFSIQPSLTDRANPPFIPILEKHFLFMRELQIWALKSKLNSTCKGLSTRHRVSVEGEIANPNIHVLLKFIKHNLQSRTTQTEMIRTLESSPELHKYLRLGIEECIKEECIKEKCAKKRQFNIDIMQTLLLRTTSKIMQNILPQNPNPDPEVPNSSY